MPSSPVTMEMAQSHQRQLRSVNWQLSVEVEREIELTETKEFPTPQPKRLKVGHDDLVSVSEGNVLVLVCKAKGSPVPKIGWYRDKVPITAQEGRISVKTNNNGRLVKLTISSTHIDDTGHYTCRAENLNGFIKKWVYVAVESKVSPTEKSITTTPVTSLAPNEEAFPASGRVEPSLPLDPCSPASCLNGECVVGPEQKSYCKCKPYYSGPLCDKLQPSSRPSQNASHTGGDLECLDPRDCIRTVDRTLTYVGIGLAGIFLLLILGISWIMARQRRKDWRVFRRKSKSSYSSKSGAAGVAFALDSSRRASVRTVGVDVATDAIFIEAGANGESCARPSRPGTALPRSVSFPADIEAPPDPRPPRQRFGTMPSSQPAPPVSQAPRPSPSDFAYHPLRSLPSGECATEAMTLPVDRGPPPSPRLVSVSHTLGRPRRERCHPDDAEVWIKQQAALGISPPLGDIGNGGGGSGGSDSGVHSTSNPLYSDSTGSGSLNYVVPPPPTGKKAARRGHSSGRPPKEVNFKDTAKTVTIAATAAHRHCLVAGGFEGPWERSFGGLPGFVTFANTQQERVCICPSHLPNGPVMAPPPPRLTTFAQHAVANPPTLANKSLPNHRPH